MLTVIYAIVLFCILIFIHELGHLLAAKASGIKVNEFAIGMGPKILTIGKGETKYSLRIFPIGGFCAMEGESDESEDLRSFNNAKTYKKAITLFAGSFMNLVLAIILMMIIAFTIGTPSTTVDTASEGKPAALAGIKQGDKIVQIDNKPIKEWNDIGDAVGAAKNANLEVVVERNSQKQTIKTEVTEEEGRKIIGITPAIEKDIGTAISRGFKSTWDMTKTMYTIIKQLVTGEVSTKELSGPVGIVYVVNQSVSEGLIYFIYLMAIISLNLAIFNLLPIPALDGGRLLFLAINKITGKTITEKMENTVHTIGMGLLLLLMLYVTWNDIIRFIVPIFD